MAGYLFSADLAYPSQIIAAAPELQLQQVMSASGLLHRVQAEPPQIVLVDLEFRGLDWANWLGELRDALPPGTPILAFGPHVRDDLLRLAEQAGCDAVVSRGRLHGHTQAVLDSVLRRTESPGG